MDVKLSLSSSWHRITDHEIRQITRLQTERNDLNIQAKAKGQTAEEKRAALMIDEEDAEHQTRGAGDDLE